MIPFKTSLVNVYPNPITSLVKVYKPFPSPITVSIANLPAVPIPWSTLPTNLPAPTNAGTKLLDILLTINLLPLYTSLITVAVPFNARLRPLNNIFADPLITVEVTSIVVLITLPGISINASTTLPTPDNILDPIFFIPLTTPDIVFVIILNGVVIISFIHATGLPSLLLAPPNNLDNNPPSGKF